jgi:hypothetical protein
LQIENNMLHQKVEMIERLTQSLNSKPQLKILLSKNRQMFIAECRNQTATMKQDFFQSVFEKNGIRSVLSEFLYTLNKKVRKIGQNFCGEGGIRTLGTGLSPYNGLANRPFRPLRHLSLFLYYLSTFNNQNQQTGPNVHQPAEPPRFPIIKWEAKIKIKGSKSQKTIPPEAGQIPASYFGIWNL